METYLKPRLFCSGLLSEEDKMPLKRRLKRMIHGLGKNYRMQTGLEWWLPRRGAHFLPLNLSEPLKSYSVPWSPFPKESPQRKYLVLGR